MYDIRRVELESRIADTRPMGVAAASWLLFPLGALGVYVTFMALAPLPQGAFSISKPVAVLSACAAVALVGFGLQFGLRTGRLWAWFGAVNWALLNGAVATLIPLGRVRGGMSPAMAISTTPTHSGLVALALGLLALLWLPGTRRWFAASHRLRSLSPEGIDRYLTGP
jgi:hypothetical protein